MKTYSDNAVTKEDLQKIVTTADEAQVVVKEQAQEITKLRITVWLVFAANLVCTGLVFYLQRY